VGLAAEQAKTYLEHQAVAVLVAYCMEHIL
jgi:hypothetical protein